MAARRRLLHRLNAQFRALLPDVFVRRTQTLAMLVVGMLVSGSVSLAKVASAVADGITDASMERTLRRWLANDGVDVEAIWAVLRPVLLAEESGRAVERVLDLTPHRKAFSVVVLGVVQHKRALPLAGRVLPQQTPWPCDFWEVVEEMTAGVATALPSGCDVTLLADRGLVSARLIDLCRRLGWHFVLRINAGASQRGRVIELPEGEETQAWALVERLGRRGSAPVRLFKTAGWREGFLTVSWAARYHERWVLFSDRPGGSARVRDYHKRWTIEAMFEDCKKRGWDLEASRLRDPERLSRLLLALYLLLWWLAQLGQRAIRHGERSRFDHPARRAKALVQLGRRLAQARLDANLLPILPFSYHNGHWRYVLYS